MSQQTNGHNQPNDLSGYGTAPVWPKELNFDDTNIQAIEDSTYLDCGQSHKPVLRDAWDTSKSASEPKTFDPSSFVSQSPTVPTVPTVTQISDDSLFNSLYIDTHTPHAWLDNFVKHSKGLSPRGFSGLHEAAGLWAMSATIAGRAFIDFGGKKRSLALMFIAAARSSVWAKSHTIGIATQLISDAGQAWRLLPNKATPQAITGTLSDNKRVIELMRSLESCDEKEEPKLRKQLEYTKSDLGNLYAHEGQRAWHISEFGSSVMAGMMKQGSVMASFSHFLRDINDKPAGQAISNITRTHGLETINYPYLPIIGDTTPADIKQYSRAGSQLWTNGFLARFLLVSPLQDDVPSNARVAYGAKGRSTSPYELTSQMVKVNNSLGKRQSYNDELILKSMDYSYEIYDEFYKYEEWLKSIEWGEDLEGNIVRQAVEKAPAIAAILAIFDGSDEVLEPHCKRAIEICERFRLRLISFYDKMTENSLSEKEVEKSQKEDKILKIIDTHYKKNETWPTLRDIRKRTGSKKYRMSNEDILKILDVLKEANFIEEFKLPKGKSYRYKIT